jgi:L-ascorbate metabolism protein UlaG (beta-lactamase superfamily)
MSKLKITSVGHATHLIEMDGEHILTDPIFSKKALFQRRLKEPGIRPEDLPPLTAIVVTHAHYTHLDLFSYKFFPLSVPIVVPLGLGKFLAKFLRNPIVEIPPWGEHTVGGVKIHTVPVRHRGFRLSGFTWRATTGYVFEKGGSKVFFPGDTAYGDHFKKIASLHEIDVALLPIGAYEPRWFMKHRHMNPSEAIDAFLDLKADIMIPYHWGVFRLSKEEPEAPLEWLKNILKEKSFQNVKILEPGEYFPIGGKTA